MDEDVRKFLLEADRMFRSGWYEQAKTEIAHALKLDPKNYYARSLLERIKQIQRDKDSKERKSIESDEKQKEERLKSISELLRNAERFIKTKEFDLALKEVAKVFAIDPKNHFAQAYSAHIDTLMQEEERLGHTRAPIPPRAPVRPQPTAPPKPAEKPVSGAPQPAKPSIEAEKPLGEGGMGHALYQEMLREMWLDGALKQDEVDTLARARKMFNVSEEEHTNLEKEVKIDAYVEALRIAWVDGKLTKNEKEILAEMRATYDISLEEHANAEAKIIWSRQTKGTKGSILIVDDDRVLLLTLAARLKDHSYEVLTAETVEEAKQKLQQKKPMFILCDLIFKNSPLDGSDFYNHVRKDSRYNDVPFLLMSVVQDQYVVRAGIRLGIDDYLIKPFEFDHLLAIIEGKSKSGK
jgi:CheY-like chemotaxis protein